MVRRYFRLRRLILGGLAFAAIAVPVAQAKHGDTGFSTERPVVAQISTHGGVTPTMSQLEAQARQYRAQQDAYGSGPIPSSQVSIHGGVTPTMSQLEAEANAYRAQLDKAEKVSTSGSGGFDWTDAGIGAGVVFGAAVILLAAVALGRRHRSGPRSAGLAKA